MSIEVNIDLYYSDKRKNYDINIKRDVGDFGTLQFKDKNNNCIDIFFQEAQSLNKLIEQLNWLQTELNKKNKNGTKK